MKRTAAVALLFLLAPDEKIVLDGRFDEPAWGRAKPWDKFYEMSPQDKIDAKVRTEVRFAYDAHAPYAAVRAHDPDLGELRAPFARRDNVFAGQDMVVLFIDPVGNRKFAHFVRANPRRRSATASTMRIPGARTSPRTSTSRS